MNVFSAQTPACPQCGAELPAEATEGLCPRCLLSQALNSPPSTQATPALKHAAVPLPEELAPDFPSYEILRILGRGGMGAVYLARQTSLNRLVAVKILPADLDDGENNFTQRFKNEARAMAQLSHPGIVAVYDFGQTTSGLLYIVMEYIDGTDVALMVTRQGRLPSAHAMAITAHVCDALAYAHGKGIIHRDIKPSNIMIGNDGVVKVADFGLAKMSQAASSGLTQSGMVMGTLHFMAPEALMLGTAVDQRADIYAVGVMLYQMLTGKLPQGLFEMPSLQVKGLDPRYDQIVARALREDRELRYPDANAMRHDLDAILTQPVVKAAAAAGKAPTSLNTLARPRRPGGRPYRPPPGQKPIHAENKRTSLPWAAVFLAVGFAAWFLFGRSKPAPIALTAVEAFVQKEEPKAGKSPTAKAPASNPPVAAISTGPAASQTMTPTALSPTSSDIADFQGGLVSWWKADGDARDAAGNNHGALVGAASYTDGLFGKAFQFDGGHVEVPDSPTLQFRPDSKFSVTFWAYRTSESRPYHLFGKRSDKRGDTGGTKGFQLGFSAPTPQFAANEWVFWAVSYDGFKQTVYVNGEPNFMFGKITPGGAVPFRIGRSGDWESFKGRIDDMRIYDRAMTASEVTSMFKSLDARLGTANTPHATSTAPPFSASKEDPFVNSLGMKFVPVPITGGPTDAQRVLFSIWETRVKDYEVFAKEKQLTRDEPPYSEQPDHPVVNVSFNDAIAYCSWLTEREKKAGWLSTEEVYRLPSDHEWSCAVGIGHLEDASKPASEKQLGIVNMFPWGSGFPPPAGAGNYNGEEESERTFSHSFKPLKGYRDNFPAMAPVGQFNPNGLGLYDLGGNAWEWCLDVPQNNTVVPVMRGATFLNSPERELFSSMRGLASAPTMISKDKGFRIVLATNKKAPAAPPPASSPAPSTNTLGMKFAPLPGTKVSMCIHETRRSDHAAFAAAVPSASAAWKSTAAADNHPVMNVSWEEATAFCAWLSKKENRRYRLPTDREWSIAAGIAAQESASAPPFKLNGAVAGVYPWSKAKIATVKAGNYAGAGDVYEQTAPVMSFPANELGFYDLGGNVWEYCADLFNPAATARVLRGASWMDSDPAALLSSCRDPVDPSARSPFVGFRIVWEAPILHPAP